MPEKREYKKRDYCKRGHRYTSKTVRWETANGYTVRRCRLCQSIYNKKNYQKQKQKPKITEWPPEEWDRHLVGEP